MADASLRASRIRGLIAADNGRRTARRIGGLMLKMPSKPVPLLSFCALSIWVPQR